ncbi:MAG: DNRLRE domain-containing protein [Thermoleophilia bacterium]
MNVPRNNAGDIQKNLVRRRLSAVPVVAVLLLAFLIGLFIISTGTAVIGPEGTYTETPAAGADKVEICTSLDAAYNCVTPTTSFTVGSTVYIRISTYRVANLGSGNTIQLRDYKGALKRSGTWTQRSASPPYIYTAAVVVPSTANYLKVFGRVRSTSATMQFEQQLDLAGVNQSMKFFQSATDRTNNAESYTFKPSTGGSTSYFYIRAYGTGYGYSQSKTGNQNLFDFNNTAVMTWGAPSVSQNGKLYDFQLALPQLGGSVRDGDWYWLPVDLRRPNSSTIVNMSRMIQLDGSNPVAAITAPADGAYIRGTVSVNGTATDLYSFNNWLLEYGAGASPATWTPLGSTGTSPVSNAALWTGDTTAVPDGLYTLRLTVNDRAGNVGQVTSQVNVDNTPPVISALGISGITSSAATATWTTDEVADSLVEYGTVSGAPYAFSSANASQVTSHSLGISGLKPLTTYYYRVRSIDRAGNVTYSGERTFRTANLTVLQPFPAVGKDTAYENAQPTFNHGAEAYLRVADSPASGTARSVIKFDLSGIPATATVVSSSMSFYQMGQGDTSTPTLNAYYLTRDWTEGTGSGSATGDGATWNSYNGVSPWTLAGGDYAGAPVGIVAPDSTAAWVSWSLPALTQSWVNGSISNRGALVKQNTEVPAGNDVKNFYSSDYMTDASLRPKLTIEWFGTDVTPPNYGEVRAENITRTSADIKWSTDENANTRVEYGTTTSYGAMTALDPAMVNQHVVSLTGLTENTYYHYRVRSIDTSGNEVVSADYGFQTARQIVIQPSGFTGADAWIDQADSTLNYGAATDLGAGNSGGTDNNRRALLSFDLSAIPAGSQVNSATMALYQHAQSDTSTPQLGVYPVSRTWVPGTGNGTATGDGATWSSYNGVLNWTTAGGDFGAVAGTATAPNSSAAWVNFSILSLAQGWVNGTTANYGVLVKKTNEGVGVNDSKTFYSADESANPTLRPTLTVEYIPAPGTISLNIDETYNRDGSAGAGSVGFGNVTAGLTYDVGSGASPAYAAKLTVSSNTIWGLKVSAFDDLKQVNPANLIAISNLFWKQDAEAVSSYKSFMKSPAETVIVSGMSQITGASFWFDYRLTLPALAVSGTYSTPVIYTAYPS